MARARTTLYFATNRRHRGRDRWRPSGYTGEFSRDGMENLRFGKLTVTVDSARVDRLRTKALEQGSGDGEALSSYFAGQVSKADIRAFVERLPDEAAPEVGQPEARLGSAELFADARKLLQGGTDVLVFIHGYNVSWKEAVASAAALQAMLNRRTPGFRTRPVQVLLFSWPSDGSAAPFVAYKSDRLDAAGSGAAVGRAFLKLRDFLASVQNAAQEDGTRLCEGKVHLLCHSMGNFVLQHVLKRQIEFSGPRSLPRLFDRVFLCASDVDEDALEPGGGLARLHEVSRSITVYFNDGDVALYLSDYTKGNPDRLGQQGAARPKLVHQKVHQVDCSEVVGGLVEHSYYLTGLTNDDIRMSIAGLHQDDPRRPRSGPHASHNTWVLDDPQVGG